MTKKLGIKPLVGAHSLLWLSDGDTLNFLLNSWTILAVAVNEENVSVLF